MPPNNLPRGYHCVMSLDWGVLKIANALLRANSQVRIADDAGGFFLISIWRSFRRSSPSRNLPIMFGGICSVLCAFQPIGAERIKRVAGREL
jgi:hypothetical protein